MREVSALPANKKRIAMWRLVLVPMQLPALPILFFSALAYGGTIPQNQERKPIGSLSAVGEVYVNGSPTSAESSIFAGDTLRTGATGIATFTASGKGSLKISPLSQVEFSSSSQYIAEIKSGTIVMTSSSGPGGVSLLARDSIVVGVNRGEQATSRVEMAANGSWVATCLEGSVGILPRDQSQGLGNGRFLQVGQSLAVPPQGQLSPPTEAVSPSSTPAGSGTSPVPAVAGSHKGWIILGVAGGGAAAGIAVALASHGGSSQTVSPSSP